MKVVRARTPVREGKQWRGGAWLAAYLWLPSLAQLRIAGRASQRDAVIMAGARPRHLGAFSSTVQQRMQFDGPRGHTRCVWEMLYGVFGY